MAHTTDRIAAADLAVKVAEGFPPAVLITHNDRLNVWSRSTRITGQWSCEPVAVETVLMGTGPATRTMYRITLAGNVGLLLDPADTFIIDPQNGRNQTMTPDGVTSV